ncbi:hypothetical protein RJT34_12278 [Clitoria ternatea]|uniref:Uncharacterized protein n=1 Tax=Clitoria ternatea TaxID=43366 RepID=A0AAN9PKS7_CLITE
MNETELRSHDITWHEDLQLPQLPKIFVANCNTTTLPLTLIYSPYTHLLVPYPSLHNLREHCLNSPSHKHTHQAL